MALPGNVACGGSGKLRVRVLAVEVLRAGLLGAEPPVAKKAGDCTSY